MSRMSTASMKSRMSTASKEQERLERAAENRARQDLARKKRLAAQEEHRRAVSTPVYCFTSLRAVINKDLCYRYIEAKYCKIPVYR